MKGIYSIQSERFASKKEREGHLHRDPLKMIGKPDNFNLVDCKAEALAQQFTLMHFAAFGAISKRECLGQSWKKKDGSAPGILNMIGLFNQTAKWVQILILTQPNLSKRTKVMKLCISVATYMKLGRCAVIPE